MWVFLSVTSLGGCCHERFNILRYWQSNQSLEVYRADFVPVAGHGCMTLDEFNVLDQYQQCAVWRGMNPPRFEPHTEFYKCKSCVFSYWATVIRSDGIFQRIKCRHGISVCRLQCGFFMREPGAD